MSDRIIIPTWEFPKNWENSGGSSFEVPSEGPIPPTLRDVRGGYQRILNRTITEVCNCMGTYGMGGPGFFGLKLEKLPKKYPEEWLVLRLWGADNWLHYNNKILDCHPNQHKDFKTVIKPDSYYTEIQKIYDKTFIGKKITSAIIRNKSCRFSLGRNKLEIKEDPVSRPPCAGSGEFRDLKDCNVLDCWIISKTGRLVV